MTDEELIESLRLWNRDDAADRIEALVKADRAQVEVIERQAETIIRINARAERLEAAVRETTQVLRQCTFQYIRVEGQYLDREEVVSRADAALKGADHE